MEEGVDCFDVPGVGGVCGGVLLMEGGVTRGEETSMVVEVDGVAESMPLEEDCKIKKMKINITF